MSSVNVKRQATNTRDVHCYLDSKQASGVDMIQAIHMMCMAIGAYHFDMPYVLAK